jgi:triacylglycerol esterase/lipase EstA (alpha/beta hydrolase family)
MGAEWVDMALRPRHRLSALALGTACALALGAPVRAQASYSVERDTALEALACHLLAGDRDVVIAGTEDLAPLAAGRAEPVLLVHGTGVNRELNFGWNYWDGLAAEGFAVCWIDLPGAALVDIQVSAEYVAHALQAMHEETGEPVDVLGHSQGGLVPRWAIKYFAAGRFDVDDYVGLATPNHGTLTADSFLFGCFESCWQMKTRSDFIAALNAGDETAGDTDYTSIYSATDELVQPVGTQELEGATNVLLQDVCAGRAVDHVNIVADHVTYELVLSALSSPGGADPEALSPGACARGAMPGTGSPDPRYFPPDWGDGSFTGSEPPLQPYATS